MKYPKHAKHAKHAEYRLLSLVLAFSLVPALAAPVPKKKPAPKVPPGDVSRGAHQLAGGDGVFGTVYTLQNEFNYEILSARYTIEPHNDYSGTQADRDGKLVWITFAIKNSDRTEARAWPGTEVTLIDDNNQNYTSGSGQTMLASQGSKESFGNLLPGQGLGQDPVKDELSIAIPVPGKAKIVKILLSTGRKNVPGEKVVRYGIAGNPGGSPKNVIKPLAKYAADPTDPTGATLAIPGSVIAGKYYPDGGFAVRFDTLTTTTEPIYDKTPPTDGNVYVVANMTGKNIFSRKASTFDFYASQSDEITVRDSDGEKYRVFGDAGYAFRHPKRDEALQSTEIEVGEEFHFRYIFMLPKNAKPASITFGQARYGHAYKLDLTTP